MSVNARVAAGKSKRGREDRASDIGSVHAILATGSTFHRRLQTKIKSERRERKQERRRREKRFLSFFVVVAVDVVVAVSFDGVKKTEKRKMNTKRLDGHNDGSDIYMPPRVHLPHSHCVCISHFTKTKKIAPNAHIEFICGRQNEVRNEKIRTC